MQEQTLRLRRGLGSSAIALGSEARAAALYAGQRHWFSQRGAWQESRPI